nr:integrase, catalytic region, zinc finger, CCHC-type, peptidase aspartic, catalytic [Tanacetum cinerariifolium]
QDRTTIAKSSTLPRDLAPRVTSLAAEEGSMQQTINELTAFCTSLQRQHSELLAKFQAQEVEINRLKERVKLLEDKEGVIGDKSGDDTPIKGRSTNEGEAAAERISNDSEEIARVLTSMDAATVLAGETNVPTGSGFIPTAGPPATVISTGSEVGPTASPIRIRRATREREDMRMNEQIARDTEVARIHTEEEIQGMIDSLDKSNETVAKYLKEYQQFASELSLEKKIELISDLVKYKEHYTKVEDFIPMGSKEEAERLKRKGINLEKESQKAATRNRGTTIVNSPQPIYDQEPSMVAEDDETSKDKEIDKLMDLISLSFKKIYKPNNNNLRTSSNTSRANQDNSLMINRSTRECQKPKRVKDAAYHREKMLLYAANSRPIFDAEPLQKVSNDDHYNVFAIDNEHPKQSEYVHNTYPIEQDAHNKEAQNKVYKTREDKELDKVIALENKVKVLDNIVYKIGQSVQTMNMINNKCQTSFAKPQFLKKAQRANPHLYDIELEVDSLRSQLETQKTQFLNEIDRLSREYYYADRMNTILGVYTELDEDLKAQLQDKGIVIRELKKLIETLKGKSVDTKGFIKTSHYIDFPQTARQVVRNTNVIKPGMYQIDTRTTQTRAPQLPQTSKNTNPRMSTSTRVIHKTNVCRPQLRSTQMKDKVAMNDSQVKFKKIEVEDDHRISSVSNKTKSVTACNDSLKSRTLNVNAICAICGKCMFDSDHYACVSKVLNDMNARTKKPHLVPISARKPKGTIRFSNDQFSLILGYEDLVQGNIMINRVYYVEGLDHNLFSGGQFCDADLKVAFRKSTCFVRDLHGNVLLTGNRVSDLYTISL